MTTTKWLLLGVLLVACQPTKQIGEDDHLMLLDADHIMEVDAADTVCTCDATSCGNRVCGRSECGYPCGECQPNEYCMQGNECLVGVGPGTACIDAYGDKVWEGDRGFRACPANAGWQQRCTCSGGGPDAWINCDANCIAICVHSPANAITCGSPGCGTGEVCCIPSTATNDRSCTTGTCPTGSYTRECDGPEDCSAGGTCCGGDFPWTSQCVHTFVEGCGSIPQYCHTSADCAPTVPNCCPDPVVTDMRSCSATHSPGCT